MQIKFNATVVFFRTDGKKRVIVLNEIKFYFILEENQVEII